MHVSNSNSQQTEETRRAALKKMAAVSASPVIGGKPLNQAITAAVDASAASLGRSTAQSFFRAFAGVMVQRTKEGELNSKLRSFLGCDDDSTESEHRGITRLSSDADVEQLYEISVQQLENKLVRLHNQLELFDIMSEQPELARKVYNIEDCYR